MRHRINVGNRRSILAARHSMTHPLSPGLRRAAEITNVPGPYDGPSEDNTRIKIVNAILSEAEALEQGPASERGWLAQMDSVITGGNHLTNYLIRHLGAEFAEKWPPTMRSLEVLSQLHSGDHFDVWCAWSAIMRFRDCSPPPA
jgi:hypothetical protein